MVFNILFLIFDFQGVLSDSEARPYDLHALSTPPAFILDQDQILIIGVRPKADYRDNSKKLIFPLFTFQSSFHRSSPPLVAQHNTNIANLMLILRTANIQRCYSQFVDWHIIRRFALCLC